VRFAFLAEAQPFDSDELVRREAIVQLAHLDVFGRDFGFAKRCLSSALTHVEADEIHGGAREELWAVGHELLSGHQDSLTSQVRLAVKEFLRDNDRCSGAVAGRTALQLGERVVDHRRLLNLFESIFLLELSVRVPLRMLMTDPRDLREVLSSGSVAADC
jgi:hypothetical protein